MYILNKGDYMEKKIIIIGFICLLTLGCMGTTENKDTSAVDTIESNGKVYSLDEISKHSMPEDCWFAISGRVYNATMNVSSHPGGQAIIPGCGKDATELFKTRPMGSGTDHSSRAYDKLKELYIGDLE